LEFGLTPPSLPEMAFNPLGWDVLGLTALAIWLYIGIEFVAPMAEETINPNKNIPRAMIAGLVIIFIVNLLYGFASIKYVPTEELASSNAPHVLVARAILGNKGALLIAVVSIFASLSTLNTVIGVVPRILYGMGINKELPRFFGVLHRSTKTPAYGILFIGGMIGVFYLGGIAQASNLIIFILAACASWLITYIIAHIDLIVLRLRYPNAERPYRSPWFPIPQVLGILGMTYSLIHIAPVPEMESQIYKIAGILVAGALVYAIVWLKFVNPAPLFKPISLEEAQKEWFIESQEVYDDEADFAAGELIESEVPVNVNSKER
jgi:amino acid transporter